MCKSFIIALLLCTGAYALLADTVTVKDKTTKKHIVFTDDWNDEDFKEVVNFFVVSHLKAYDVPENLKESFEVSLRSCWENWYNDYLAAGNPYNGNVIIARHNNQIVGACVYYQAEVEFPEDEMFCHLSSLFNKRLSLDSDNEDQQLPENAEEVFNEINSSLPCGPQLALCVLESFSDCQKFGTRTFVNGYRKLALRSYPDAVYWIASAPRKRKSYYESFKRAGFVKTLVYCPHLSRKERRKVRSFMRKIV